MTVLGKASIKMDAAYLRIRDVDGDVVFYLSQDAPS
jgi:hypothetical protein